MHRDLDSCTLILLRLRNSVGHLSLTVQPVFIHASIGRLMTTGQTLMIDFIFLLCRSRRCAGVRDDCCVCAIPGALHRILSLQPASVLFFPLFTFCVIPFPMLTNTADHQVVKDSLYEAFYRLTDSREQIKACAQRIKSLAPPPPGPPARPVSLPAAPPLTHPSLPSFSFVFDVVRSTVPKILLDDVFIEKEEIAASVKDELCKAMSSFGFAINHALVTDISPDAMVKRAMNEVRDAGTPSGTRTRTRTRLHLSRRRCRSQLELILPDSSQRKPPPPEHPTFLLASLLLTPQPHNPTTPPRQVNVAQRLRVAASDKAEAEKIMVVKQAEADAEAKFLAGTGIARQRQAIVNGLRQSVVTFSEEVQGVNSKDVLDLLLVTQYFDTLKEVGASSKCGCIRCDFAAPRGALESRSASAALRRVMLCHFAGKPPLRRMVGRLQIAGEAPLHACCCVSFCSRVRLCSIICVGSIERRSNTIFIPHGPGAVGDAAAQIRTGLLQVPINCALLFAEVCAAARAVIESRSFCVAKSTEPSTGCVMFEELLVCWRRHYLPHNNSLPMLRFPHCKSARVPIRRGLRGRQWASSRTGWQNEGQGGLPSAKPPTLPPAPLSSRRLWVASRSAEMTTTALQPAPWLLLAQKQQRAGSGCSHRRGGPHCRRTRAQGAAAAAAWCPLYPATRRSFQQRESSRI